MITQHPLYPLFKELLKLVNSLAVAAIILTIAWGEYKGSDDLVLSAASWVPTYLKAVAVIVAALICASVAEGYYIRSKAKDALQGQ
jgi:hypothetical protein